MRLLTLTGPAGVGKTRLALEAGACLAEQFAHGVAVVDLSPTRDSSLVLPVIAHALGMRDAGRRPLQNRLAEFLCEREMLLILDNFEQVLSAAGDITGLLAACPRVQILTTSRVSLQLRWEHTLRVLPLRVPDIGALPTMEELAEFPSIALFLERGRARLENWAMTESEAPLVAQLVSQLDGLPLAIEQAAAHLDVLPLAVITDRLYDRLQLLKWDAQDLPDRHRSLEAAIGWSYGLLTDAEQQLFRHLGVFADRVSPEGANAVMGGKAAALSLEGLASLAQKSLVLPAHIDSGEGRAEPHFRLLETVREYAEDLLKRHGELERARGAHAEYFLTLAERADHELRGPSQLTWSLRLEHEHSNLRAALRWFRDQSDGEGLLRLVGALGDFWVGRGYHAEGRRWLEEALSWTSHADASTRTRALLAAGCLLPLQEEFARARDVLEEALTLAQQRRDPRDVAQALTYLGLLALQSGDLAESGRLLQEALARWEELGDTFHTGFVLGFLGALSLRHGSYQRAASLYSDALARWERVGNVRTSCAFTFHLALVVKELGDFPRALQLIQEGVQVTMRFQDRWFLGMGLEATLLLIGNQAAPEQRARLLGARDSVDQATGSVPGILERVLGQAIGSFREQLEQPELAAAYREGRSLAFEQIVALTRVVLQEFARSLQRLTPAYEQQQVQGNVLSERELEVLRLVAQGYSNKVIGRQLYISTSTVNHHLTSIFHKLDVDARAQAVAVAARRGML